MSLFAFDYSRRALVYADPETGKPRHITVSELASIPLDALGDKPWVVDEAELRKLPRWDAPLIQTAAMMPPLNGSHRRR